MNECPLPSPVLDAIIDVSHYNGAIDWPAVAAAGIALVFVKATQGAGFVDPAFERNSDGAAQAGLAVVPYHFLDTGDPADQADHFLDVAGLASGQLAMIDWETRATAEAVVTFGEAVADVIARDPLAYYGWAQLRQAHPTLSRWPLMLPAYPGGETQGTYETLVSRPPRLPPGRAAAWDVAVRPRPYDFHQYTPAGRVAGIPGPVDRSIWVGTLADLQAWLAPPVATKTPASAGVASPSPPSGERAG